MRIIVGYGNELRGEDAFGIDVIKQLKSQTLKNTKLISTFQLTPELCLDLIEAKEVIFIDACYSNSNHYELACSLESINTQNLSHHMDIKLIIKMLNELYSCYPKYEVYSMITNSFEKIKNESKYKRCITKIAIHLKT